MYLTYVLGLFKMWHISFQLRTYIFFVKELIWYFIVFVYHSYITSFFRFVDKRAIYRLDIISLALTPVHVIDFSVVNVHVDELSSARICQHQLCATFSANVNINCRLPIKNYDFSILSRNREMKFTNIRQSMLNLKTHSGFHDLFRFWYV